MQVLFPKHVWLHTEYMPTLDWRTGASYLSLRVIAVTWWITSVTLIHHRSTAYESFTTGPCYVTLSRLVPCYKRDWATLLLLLLLLSLCCCCHYWCYLLLCCCCYYCSLLLRCYLLQDFVGAIPGEAFFSRIIARQRAGAIDTTVRNSLPLTHRFRHRCYHTTLLLILCLRTIIF